MLQCNKYIRHNLGVFRLLQLALGKVSNRNLFILISDILLHLHFSFKLVLKSENRIDNCLFKL